MATISSAVAKLDKLIIRKSRVIDSSLASTIRNHIGYIAERVKAGEKENAQLKQEILNIQKFHLEEQAAAKQAAAKSMCALINQHAESDAANQKIIERLRAEKGKQGLSLAPEKPKFLAFKPPAVHRPTPTKIL